MSNKILVILLVVLAVAAIIIYFPSDNKSERTFKTELVDIDTSVVNEIIISPKSMNGGSFRLFKDDNRWKVTLPE